MSQTFLYFAYGSNMFTERIRYNNPSAVQKCIGKLKDHRLDFNKFTNRWQGCVATIVPCSGSEVWGVVWEINKDSMAALDNQEGVNDNVYLTKNVNIETENRETLECKIYQQCQLPEIQFESKSLPPERQPSFVYLNIIIKGAEDHNLPVDYINFLKSFPHNGYDGEIKVDLSLTDKKI